MTVSGGRFQFPPELLRGDLHGLRPNGAGSGDHEEKEAADSQDLEGRVQDRPGPEPGLLLHPLHDDGEGEHAGGRHGDPGYDHLQGELSSYQREEIFPLTDLRDSLIGAGLGQTGGLAGLVSQGHPLQQLLLPH